MAQSANADHIDSQYDTFWFAFSRKMHENWCGIQSKHLEYIGAFVKIDHRKKQIIGIALRVSE